MEPKQLFKKSRKFYFLLLLLLIFTVPVALSGCGGGGGGNSSTSTVSYTTITGGVYDGPVSGESLSLYKIGSSGTVQVGGTKYTTNTDGSFTISIPNYVSSSDYLVVSNGGLINNSGGAAQPAPTMSSLLLEFNKSVYVTPLSTMLTKGIYSVTNNSIVSANLNTLAANQIAENNFRLLKTSFAGFSQTDNVSAVFNTDPVSSSNYSAIVSDLTNLLSQFANELVSYAKSNGLSISYPEAMNYIISYVKNNESAVSSVISSSLVGSSSSSSISVNLPNFTITVNGKSLTIPVSSSISGGFQELTSLVTPQQPIGGGGGRGGGNSIEYYSTNSCYPQSIAIYGNTPSTTTIAVLNNLVLTNPLSNSNGFSNNCQDSPSSSYTYSYSIFYPSSSAFFTAHQLRYTNGNLITNMVANGYGDGPIGGITFDNLGNLWISTNDDSNSQLTISADLIEESPANDYDSHSPTEQVDMGGGQSNSCYQNGSGSFNCVNNGAGIVASSSAGNIYAANFGINYINGSLWLFSYATLFSPTTITYSGYDTLYDVPTTNLTSNMQGYTPKFPTLIDKDMDIFTIDDTENYISFPTSVQPYALSSYYFQQGSGVSNIPSNNAVWYGGFGNVPAAATYYTFSFPIYTLASGGTGFCTASPNYNYTMAKAITQYFRWQGDIDKGIPNMGFLPEGGFIALANKTGSYYNKILNASGETAIEPFGAGLGPFGFEVSGITIGPNGDLWIAVPYAVGILPDNGSKYASIPPYNDPDGLPCYDSNSTDSGYIHTNPDNGWIIQLNPAYTTTTGNYDDPAICHVYRTNPGITDIISDPEGNIWATTGYFQYPIVSNLFSAPQVNSVIELQRPSSVPSGPCKPDNQPAYTMVVNNLTAGMNPQSLAIDSQGNVWVVDSEENGFVTELVDADNSGVSVPAAPALTEANLSGHTVTLQWDASSDTQSYEVYESTAGSTFNNIGDTTSTSWQTGGLNIGTQYCFEISAENNIGQSGMSNEKCLTPTSSSTIPNPPTLETATAGNGSVKLSWTSASGASSYTVFDSLSNSNYGEVSNTFSTSYTVSGLPAGRTYYFVVTAQDNAGESGYSNDLSQRVPSSPPPPQPPTNLSATPGNGNVTFSWLASDYATSYNITYTNNGSATTANTSGTTYNVTNLTNGTAYTFSVTAQDSSGNSSAVTVSATPIAPTGPPQAPTISSYGKACFDGRPLISLGWTNSSGATSYSVYLNGNLSKNNITSTSYTEGVAGLSTTYKLSVEAVNSAGTAMSNPVSVTTPSSCPNSRY